MSSPKSQPEFIYWEDSWNRTDEDLNDSGGETIMPNKV